MFAEEKSQVGFFNEKKIWPEDNWSKIQLVDLDRGAQ